MFTNYPRIFQACIKFFWAILITNVMSCQPFCACRDTVAVAIHSFSFNIVCCHLFLKKIVLCLIMPPKSKKRSGELNLKYAREAKQMRADEGESRV